MPPSRRGVLRALGLSAVATPTVAGYAHVRERRRLAATGDGIEPTPELEATLEDTFGSQFEGFDPDRLDLLVDVRRVGEATISEKTADYLTNLFRSNGIYLQWLEHPTVSDSEWFRDTFGYDARRILWGPDSFYETAVEPALRNVAVQLVVLRGTQGVRESGVLFSPLAGALGESVGSYVNGYSLGNRAVVADRVDWVREASLVLHELGHLGLCHDDNPGVMGRSEMVDLTPAEWERLRERVANVHDVSGFDVVLRPCLWRELFTDLA